MILVKNLKSLFMITAPDEKLHIGDTNHYMLTWAFSYFIILNDLFTSWHNYIFHYDLHWDSLITSSAAVLPQPLSVGKTEAVSIQAQFHPSLFLTGMESEVFTAPANGL